MRGVEEQAGDVAAVRDLHADRAGFVGDLP